MRRQWGGSAPNFPLQRPASVSNQPALGFQARHQLLGRLPILWVLGQTVLSRGLGERLSTHANGSDGVSSQAHQAAVSGFRLCPSYRDRLLSPELELYRARRVGIGPWGSADGRHPQVGTEGTLELTRACYQAQVERVMWFTSRCTTLGGTQVFPIKSRLPKNLLVTI